MADTNLHIAETIQAASLHGPSGTAGGPPFTQSTPEPPHYRRHHQERRKLERSPSDADSLSTGIVDPSRMVRHESRKAPLPPLPDLRFEQSYLASLRGAESWGRIAWITMRDQVFLPLIQGTLWTLALCGWRYWHRGAQVTGSTAGFKIRQLWWKLNGWDTTRL